MFGAMAMSLSSFCVVMNALRLNLVNPFNSKHDYKRKRKTNNKKTNKEENKTMKKTIKINIPPNKYPKPAILMSETLNTVWFWTEKGILKLVSLSTKKCVCSVFENKDINNFSREFLFSKVFGALNVIISSFSSPEIG